ncbi:hypothetical protein TNCV_813231 [Trichonephila clavipes]|nr:hypothetical protein TNCV_813231 [Trichonephila clavipes]
MGGETDKDGHSRGSWIAYLWARNLSGMIHNDRDRWHAWESGCDDAGPLPLIAKNLSASIWISKKDYLGEYVFVKSPLHDICHCLPLAKVTFKTKGGEFYAKATIKSDSNSSVPYLLSNRKRNSLRQVK